MINQGFNFMTETMHWRRKVIVCVPQEIVNGAESNWSDMEACLCWSNCDCRLKVSGLEIKE